MDALGFAYVIGAMVGFLLLLVFAVALTRVRLIPTWASWLLVVGTAAGLLLANQGGFIVFGLAWAVLGYVLSVTPPSEEQIAGADEASRTASETLFRSPCRQRVGRRIGRRDHASRRWRHHEPTGPIQPPSE
jgi:hypothetical protein